MSLWKSSNPQLSLSTFFLRVHILSYPLTPTMRLEAIRSIIPISCRRYPKSVWNVFLLQLLYRSEDSVWATSANCRMKREMVHQMSSDILGYMSHHRSRCSWENMTMWSQIAPWSENIPPKGVSFSDLICIFAMSIVEFSCLFCNTKISEFFDMAKSWAARLRHYILSLSRQPIPSQAHCYV